MAIVVEWELVENEEKSTCLLCNKELLVGEEVGYEDEQEFYICKTCFKTAPEILDFGDEEEWEELTADESIYEECGHCNSEIIAGKTYWYEADKKETLCNDCKEDEKISIALQPIPKDVALINTKWHTHNEALVIEESWFQTKVKENIYIKCKKCNNKLKVNTIYWYEQETKETLCNDCKEA